MKDWLQLTTEDGNIYLKRGETILPVPSLQVCRDTLIGLIERNNKSEVLKFWLDRTQAMSDQDYMKAEWARLCYERLDALWNELYTPPENVEPHKPMDIFEAYEGEEPLAVQPPQAVDIFGGFGL